MKVYIGILKRCKKGDEHDRRSKNRGNKQADVKFPAFLFWQRKPGIGPLAEHAQDHEDIQDNHKIDLFVSVRLGSQVFWGMEEPKQAGKTGAYQDQLCNKASYITMPDKVINTNKQKTCQG